MKRRFLLVRRHRTTAGLRTEPIETAMGQLVLYRDTADEARAAARELGFHDAEVLELDLLKVGAA